jgi:hypothetical protein
VQKSVIAGALLVLKRRLFKIVASFASLFVAVVICASHAAAGTLPIVDNSGHRIGSCEESTCTCTIFRVYFTAAASRGFIREQSLAEAEAYIKTQVSLAKYLDPNGSNPGDFRSPEIFCEIAAGDRHPSNAAFTRPSLTGIEFPKSSLDLLKELDYQEKALGVAQSLLSWSPLAELVGESNAVHVAVSIQSTDWDQLARSVGALQHGGFVNLANECEEESVTTAGKVATFWKDMAEFYRQGAGFSR